MTIIEEMGKTRMEEYERHKEKKIFSILAFLLRKKNMAFFEIPKFREGLLHNTEAKKLHNHDDLYHWCLMHHQNSRR
jgi:hypothetical protein